VVGLDGATAISVGGFHTCARRNDGRVVCWGENDRGQLGDSTTTPRTAPTPVTGLTNVVELAAGASHSCARLADRTVQCWGSNEAGQLAVPGATSRSQPGRVPGVTDAVAIRARNDETCVLSGDGRVTCWGPSLGQLGGRQEGRGPWLVLDPAARARAFALGGDHLCIATAGDELICRGGGRHGQLCDGSSPPRSSTFPPPP
jgi:regulator of chromosome condensation (RCC1) repeat-containing protein